MLGGWVVLMLANSGCFSERSFRLQAGGVARPAGVPDAPSSNGSASIRPWLEKAHAGLAHYLPPTDAAPLLTADLSDASGHPVDAFAHFGIDPHTLQSLFKNFTGLRYSAQAASRDYYIDKIAPPWPGFEDIWIPINDQLELSGRIGFARDAEGRIRDADCLVILPGLFGDNGVKRSADLAIPLREYGYHVLSLELRGHGQTEARYPDMYHTFGVLETDDLMKVSDWLEAQPHVSRTGLIGYCWSANIALLAAWFDGRTTDDPALLSASIAPHLSPPAPQRHRFTAGVMAFSPVLRWGVLMDELDRPRSKLGRPIFAAIQDTVRDRMTLKGYPNPDGNLRRLVECEFGAYHVPMPRGAREGYSFLRLLPYKNEQDGHKLEWSRVPVLIVQAADDPLVPCQDVADLVATVHNPKMAALILPSGGHVGFAGYAPTYYFSLIANFFDPNTGAAAALRAPTAQTVRSPSPEEDPTATDRNQRTSGNGDEGGSSSLSAVQAGS